jgi:hypothetical protein
MNCSPPPDPYRRGSNSTPAQSWSGWKIAGIVVATVIGLCGLALLMGIILVVVSLNSYGSNK